MGLKQGADSIEQRRPALCLYMRETESRIVSKVSLPNPRPALCCQFTPANVSNCCNLELHDYFWATFSTPFPAANYEKGIKTTFVCDRIEIGNYFGVIKKKKGWRCFKVLCLGWEMVLAPEIISILIISVRRKLEKQQSHIELGMKLMGWEQRKTRGIYCPLLVFSVKSG